jgi:hypothetical protein
MRFIGKQLGRKPSHEPSPGTPSLADLCAQFNIRIRRQHRASLMMRPVPGGFDVYIPRWMKPSHPQVYAFVCEGVEKFGGKAPPLPPEQTPRNQIIEMVAHWAERMGVQPKRVTLREMRRKWGSCSSREHITLSTRLTWVPPRLAEYVVVHELVHLTVFNHGPDFKAAMTAWLPDWKDREQELDRIQFSSLLHLE